MRESQSIRWLVTGAGGMLGNDVAEILAVRGQDAVALTRGQLDITDRKRVLETARQVQPDIIVNCAAFTRVVDCEADRERADLVNGEAVGNLAEAANENDTLLVQVSTDFVFDGGANKPYEPDARTRPLSAYGESKLLGEREAEFAKKHLIVRTSWLFGKHGHNFVEAIRKQIDPYISAGNAMIDDIIDPRETRPVVIRALELAANKHVERPWKKHGVMPV